MARVLDQRRVLHKTVPGTLLVLAMVVTLAVTPLSVAASSHARAAVTTSSVAYSLSGQAGGVALAGWVSGTKDSTGVVTATVTVADPATNAPVMANLNGRIVGSGSSATALFAVTPMAGSTMMMGMAGNVALAGAPVGSAGAWAGTITRGSATVGAWTLTPQTSTLHIDAGGRSAATSKDKVAVSGAINVGVTASGWADGTFATFDGTKTYVVHGWVNGGDVAISIPWGKTGDVELIGTIRPVLDHHGWTGNFIGPAPGDFGTWAGQG